MEKDTGIKFMVMKGGDMYFYRKDEHVELICLLHDTPDVLCGSEVYYKVVGMNAASLLADGKIKSLYTNVIGEDALILLENMGIHVDYKHIVDYIK